jgi:hypothetical protein
MLPSCCNRCSATGKFPKIDPVLLLGHVGAALPMDLMITIGLSLFIDIVASHDPS